MQIIGKCLKTEEFRKYVEKKFFGFLPANKIVLHHTHKPTPEQWEGKRTIYNLKRFYERKGWTTGPHLFIAPDGIWLFTDMRKNGTHAGKGNWRSIGIEMVGDYDKEVPKGTIWEYAKFVITVLNRKLNLKKEDIKFHRDYMNTHCPGLAVDKKWVLRELAQYSTFPNGSILKSKNKSTVYYVFDNVKYPIPDWDTYQFYWEEHIPIKEISDIELSNLTEGKILPSIKTIV